MSKHGEYAALSQYGMLADGQAGALVGADGTIDWLAAPRLDSPPLCAALLDPAAGGSFTLAPVGGYESEQRYLDDTLVLQTIQHCGDGTVRITDALNRGWGGPLPWTELARVVEAEDGEVPMRWRFTAGHRLGSGPPVAARGPDSPVLQAGALQVAVVTDGAGTPTVENSAINGEFVARPGHPVLIAILVSDGEPLRLPEPRLVRERVDGTCDAWRRWSAGIGYDGPHGSAVRRSALTLKALTLATNGALAAALTTSLPEHIGGSRNYDYRFSWPRDSSFSLDALLRLGLDEDVHRSLAWLLHAVRATAPRVRAFYDLDGQPVPAETTTVDVAPGYRGSAPVRLGNPAAEQLQLGAYGDVLEAAAQYARRGGRLDAASASTLAQLADRVSHSWRERDAGLWELGNPAHYTSSKIGCWAALDRAIQLAESGQLRDGNVEHWRAERLAMRQWIDEHCWSPSRRSYTFHSDTEDLDAAVLLAARTGYLAGDDPRLASTIDAVREELGAGGPLLYRYSGMASEEGAFLACSFWLVEALCAAGRVDEAADLFDELVGYGGSTGILSEEADPRSGELLGNLPQALTHLALIGAATALADAARVGTR